MLPSKGLSLRHPLVKASRQSPALRSGASRKISSFPKRAIHSQSPCQTNPLHSASWRVSASPNSNVVLSSSTVRYASWYAPWTWGRSNSSSNATTPSLGSEPSTTPVAGAEPVVTTATPELAPAGIDKPAVTADTAPISDSKTIEQLLETDPTPVASVVDPTALISYWGNLKDLGIDYGWGPSSLFSNLLELTYLNTDFGWGGTIITSALLLRLFMFVAFQRPGSDAMAKIAAMNPVLQPLMNEMEAAKKAGDDQKYELLKMKQASIMRDSGTSVFKGIGTSVAQMVFGFGAFRSIRGMRDLPVPGLETDGFLWFSDLTVSDPFYVLPAATGGLMYFVLKMGGETGVSTKTMVTSMQKQIQLFLPVFMAGIMAFQPAALQIYFLLTSATGGVTGYALRQPGFRRLIGIRQLPSKASDQLYAKAAKGEINLSALRGPDGKIRYQAPSSPSSATTQTESGRKRTTTLDSRINLRSGVMIPSHLRTNGTKGSARDADYEQGMPKDGGVGEKWSWIKKHYTPKKVWGRTAGAFSEMDPTAKAAAKQKDKDKQALRKYEEERKKRFATGR